MLKVENLETSYGQSLILRGLSFEVKPCEIVAVMGRNGMGKTTLMKSLMGVVRPRSGKITVDDEDVTMQESYRHVNAGIAYVPQGRHVFSTLTVEDNLRTGLRKGSDPCEVLPEIYSIFPVLQEMRKRRAGNLSGGQQQQLAIGRALAAEPSVLILDEPTEGIQPSIIKEMAHVINDLKLSRDLAIVVSEQVLSFTIDIADRMYVIESGRFIDESVRGEIDAEKISRFLSV
jgi:urea ABC transporter, ATP-binding protein UrtE